MIDVHSGSAEKVGTVSWLVRANGLDLKRSRAFADIAAEAAAPVRKPNRMPNGDPPSLMLWGAEEEET